MDDREQQEDSRLATFVLLQVRQISLFIALCHVLYLLTILGMYVLLEELPNVMHNERHESHHIIYTYIALRIPKNE